MIRQIRFLIYPGFDLLDLSGPLAVFHHAELIKPGSYNLQVTSMTGGEIESSSGIRVSSERAVRESVDTVIIIGGLFNGALASTALIDYIRKLPSTSRRATSVCTGAFLLAEAGLLNEKSATTHWLHTPDFKERYPLVHVEEDCIFINDSNIWTSAGVTAGIDLSLTLVEEDLGFAISKSVARMLVVYHRRSGGQRQHSSLLDIDPTSDRLRSVLEYAREHISEPLSVKRLASFANLSTRQFARAFRASTGMTPAKAIERLRSESARVRLEGGHETLKEIARAVGFADTNRMRRSFLRVFGKTPQAIRPVSASKDDE
jgi:transcriptional regulator GlxA family with amidase domain